MTLDLTPRNVPTLVAALHAWQNELSYHTVRELRTYHPELCGHEPLSIEEVDGLLAQLQAAAPQQEASEATVSSVSVSTGGGS